MLVELSVVEQRYHAVMEVVGSLVPVTEVAERYGVSRKTVHAWVHRYEAEGLAGLADRSHRPYHQPRQVSAQVEAAICELRRAHRRWGPRRLVWDEGDELASEALRVGHSAVDRSLAEDPSDAAPLEKLIDAIVEDPITADRTSIHFALTRMRREGSAHMGVRTRLNLLIETAWMMPRVPITSRGRFVIFLSGKISRIGSLNIKLVIGRVLSGVLPNWVRCFPHELVTGKVTC